jgi:uncharacterized YkwD family protein
MLKRLLAIFLVLIMSLSLAAGCNTPAKKPAPPANPPKSTPKQMPRASAIQSPPTNPTTPPAGTAGQFERRVVQLVNVERQKVGHDPLSENQLLDKGAMAKAADMRDKRYFSHTSPTYGSPFKMMKTYGVRYTRAGENIASGYKTPEAVVKGWMNSPGHRANILSTKYGKLGIGYAKGGKSGAYWVQWFTN